MDRLLCGSDQCWEYAINFCLSCKKFQCMLHRNKDIKEQQKRRDTEHYYIDPLQYMRNESKYSQLYCKEHPNQFLIRRCINCFQFACNTCLPQWCAKAGGRYHDYNMIKDFVGSYKDKVYELQMRLQKKHQRFLLHLKEAYQKQDKTKSKLEELLNQAVEAEDGEKLKQDIVNEMFQVSTHIEEQLQSIEEKEVISRQLLDEMQGIIHEAGSFMAVHSYARLQEEVKNLMNWKLPKTETPKFLLCTGTEPKSLGLELIKMVSTPMEVTEEDAPEQPEQSKTEIKLVKSWTSEGQGYWGLRFLSEDKVITCGLDEVGLSVQYFTEIREGEAFSRQTYDSQVLQLLPYGNRLLMLTYNRPNYRVRFQNTGTALYEFPDPYYYFSNKLLAVTCDHQLMVLQGETQTLHVIHLETKAEKDLSLRSVGKTVYSVMASEDKLILLCKEGEEEVIHSVIKYNPELQQVVWLSDSLLTVTDEDWVMWDQLHVAGYLDFLYVISCYRPTKLFRISLSDGRVVQEIPCDGLPALPEQVLDISLRGNTLAAAGSDTVSYYKISDITDII